MGNKKKIQVILAMMIVALFTSCTKDNKHNTLKDNTVHNEWRVIEIDSCEYIYGTALYQGYLAHKGNCKYCEKRRKENDK